MCNNAEGATKCGEGLPLIEDILEDVHASPRYIDGW